MFRSVEMNEEVHKTSVKPYLAGGIELAVARSVDFVCLFQNAQMVANVKTPAVVNIVLSIWLLSACVYAGQSRQTLKASVPTAIDYLYDEKSAVLAADGREIELYIDRPKAIKAPILLVIDGSGCTGQMRPGFQTLFQPTGFDGPKYARVRIEKPGVESGSVGSENCTETFYRHYSIHDRLLDHLRVLQHLRYSAKWWNGELYIWGWSDGGDIAAQLASYYPNVTRAVLGGMGGGYTMAEHFTEIWVCAGEQSKEDKGNCVRSLQDQFEQMIDNPTWTKTWSGSDNSWKAWASRLNTRLSNLLSNNSTSVLIVQGSMDFDGAPVDSARKLITDLRDAGNTNFIYWEVAGMGHTWSSLSAEDGALIESAMLKWLLSGELSIDLEQEVSSKSHQN